MGLASAMSALPKMPSGADVPSGSKPPLRSVVTALRVIESIALLCSKMISIWPALFFRFFAAALVSPPAPAPRLPLFRIFVLKALLPSCVRGLQFGDCSFPCCKQASHRTFENAQAQGGVLDLAGCEDLVVLICHRHQLFNGPQIMMARAWWSCTKSISHC